MESKDSVRNRLRAEAADADDRVDYENQYLGADSFATSGNGEPEDGSADRHSRSTTDSLAHGRKVMNTAIAIAANPGTAAVEYVRSRPVVAVLISAVVGFVFARLQSRGR